MQGHTLLTTVHTNNPKEFLLKILIFVGYYKGHYGKIGQPPTNCNKNYCNYNHMTINRVHSFLPYKSVQLFSIIAHLVLSMLSSHANRFEEESRAAFIPVSLGWKIFVVRKYSEMFVDKYRN